MKNKVLITSFFLTTLTISQTLANDDLNKIFTLAEDVRDVVTSPELGAITNKFSLTGEEVTLRDELLDQDKETNLYLEAVKNKKDCNDEKGDFSEDLRKRVAERKFRIEAMVIANSLKFEQNALGRFMADEYSSFMYKEYMAGNTAAVQVYNTEYLENSFKNANPSVKLDSLNLVEKEKLLNAFAAKVTGKPLPEGVLLKEMTFQHLMNNSGDWKKSLSTVKDHLSSEQKIQLVSKLGGYFSNQYNYSRSEAGAQERGKFVSTRELLDSAKNGTPGGICRDIALAQTQFLNELGYKDSYVVGYKTEDSHHATVITMDPVTKKIIKFNYDETTEMKAGSGTEALNQDTSLPDYGVSYRIYDSSGKPVTKFSSELSNMLKDTSGADQSRNFAAKNYSVASVGFKTDLVDGNIFTGKTSTGKNVYGVAVYKDSKVNELFKTSIGGSVSKVMSEKSNIETDQTNLYLRASAEINSPAIKLGPVESKLVGGINSEILVSNIKRTQADGSVISESKKQIDSQAEAYFGVDNKVELNNKDTVVNAGVYATIYPDWNHNARNDKTVPVLDSVVIKSGVTHKVSDDTKALIDTAIIMKNYGTSMMVKAVLEDEKRNLRASVGAALPITKDMPSFLPGAQKRVMASIEKATPKVIYSIELERNLDNKSTTVSGKVKGSF